MDWKDALPGPIEMDPSEVHLWRFPTAEADKATIVREVLAGYLKCAPAEIEIARDPRGKPRLTGEHARLRFNLSDSGDWAVLAVATFEVGVDVEQVRSGRETARLTDRFLTAGERDRLRARATAGETAFFTVWSRKEAYLKAIGVGLSVPFSNIDSSPDRLPDLDENGTQRADGTPWAVQELFIDERHPAAVVARAKQFSLRGFTLGGAVP